MIQEHHIAEALRERERLAWAAGFIACRGSFTQHYASVKLQVRLRGAEEALMEFADAVGMGVEVRAVRDASGKAHQLTLIGKDLHEVMEKLWPWLTADRKREYQAILDRVAR